MTAPKKRATAPRPKKEAPDERAELAAAQKRWAEITIGDTGVSFKWNLNMLPVSVRAHVADVENGKTPEEIVYSTRRLSTLTYANIWWLSRLAGGEDVTHEQVLAEWDERFKFVTLADIIDVECDPPEAFAQPA